MKPTDMFAALNSTGSATPSAEAVEAQKKWQETRTVPEQYLRAVTEGSLSTTDSPETLVARALKALRDELNK